MFGYIVANRAALSEEQARRYRACYCGLCQALKARHGGYARLTISYDMTFLALLLASLYEPAEQAGLERCVTHPVKRHAYWRTLYSDYAADMNIALSYFKCLDDWADERKAPEYVSAQLLKKAYGRVREHWPRQCGAMEQALAKLGRLEKENCPEADRMANLFGNLMAELLVYEEDQWAKYLRPMGQALGAFIYIMDAALDLADDQKRGLYNPLLAFAKENNGWMPAQEGILTMLIGDAATEFEKLPLVQDAGLLRNILYSGVWQRYRAKQQKQAKQGQDRSGHGGN